MYLHNNTILQEGKYKIVRHISSGGFGNTYEGLDFLLNKRVAIKEFYVNEELKEIIVRYADNFGKATAKYNPICIPKYVSKFMEKHNKKLFTSEYEKEKFGIMTYIYRKEEKI